MIKVRVEVFEQCDGPGWLALCEDDPDMAGFGEDEDEAVAAAVEAFADRVLH